MKNQYLVKENDLKSVADKIREKSGTNNNLVFPAGFNSAIDNISAGSNKPEVITELTVEKDVNQVAINITEEMKNKYDVFVFYFNITMSESDWLYIGADKSKMQNYFSKSQSVSRPIQKNPIPIIIMKNPVDIAYVGFFPSSASGSSYLLGNTWEDLQGFYFSTYTSGVTITAGSTIKMIGVNSIYVD